MSRSLWTALAAAVVLVIAGAIFCLRGLEPDKGPAAARGEAAAIPAASPPPPPAPRISTSAAPNAVPPPHEIAPAPPFGQADPP